MDLGFGLKLNAIVCDIIKKSYYVVCKIASCTLSLLYSTAISGLFGVQFNDRRELVKRDTYTGMRDYIVGRTRNDWRTDTHAQTYGA